MYKHIFLRRIYFAAKKKYQKSYVRKSCRAERKYEKIKSLLINTLVNIKFIACESHAKHFCGANSCSKMVLQFSLRKL